VLGQRIFLTKAAYAAPPITFVAHWIATPAFRCYRQFAYFGWEYVFRLYRITLDFLWILTKEIKITWDLIVSSWCCSYRVKR